MTRVRLKKLHLCSISALWYLLPRADFLCVVATDLCPTPSQETERGLLLSKSAKGSRCYNCVSTLGGLTWVMRASQDHGSGRPPDCPGPSHATIPRSRLESALPELHLCGEWGRGDAPKRNHSIGPRVGGNGHWEAKAARSRYHCCACP